MSEATPTVHVAYQDRGEGRIVATVTIDNERRLNSLGTPLLEQIVATMAEVAAKPGLHAVVLTGAGNRAFVGGADIREIATLDTETAAAFITRVHKSCEAMRRVPVPVIAKVRGYCLGAGLEIMAACDMRITDETGRFGMPEVRVGVPSVVEACLLPQLIGWGRTRELVYLARTYDANEASAMGLVERVVKREDLDAATEEWVQDLLLAGNNALRLQKKLVAEWEVAGTPEEAVGAGIRRFAEAFEGDEPARMAGAFVNRPR